MPTRYQRPPIWNEIGDRVKNRPPRAKNAHLSVEDKLLILWGVSREWSVRRIAEALPCSPTTVKSYRQQVWEDPRVVFDLPVLVQVSERRHQCQFCGESRPARKKAMLHFLVHVLPYEAARNVPLDDVAQPL